MNIAMIGSGAFAIADSVYMCRKGNVRIFQTEPVNNHTINAAQKFGAYDEDIKIDSNLQDVIKDANIIFVNIDVPYDIELNSYDMQAFEIYINKIMQYSPNTPVVIRSQIPIGYTRRLIQRYPN